MRLLSCRIENFGKLTDFTYDFEEDLNMLFAENGWGEADKPRMVMIGDRRFDVEGAKALGLDCVGVLYGYGSREELEDADEIKEKLP